VTFVDATHVPCDTFQEVNRFNTKKMVEIVNINEVPAGIEVRIVVSVDSPLLNLF
jgi:hypothetical protein